MVFIYLRTIITLLLIGVTFNITAMQQDPKEKEFIEKLSAGKIEDAYNLLKNGGKLFIHALSKYSDELKENINKTGDVDSYTSITLLGNAAQYGNEAIMKFALDYGADINAQEKKFGFSPLELAVFYDKVSAVKLLINSSNLSTESKENALYLAQKYSDQNSPEIIALISGSPIQKKERRKKEKIEDQSTFRRLIILINNDTSTLPNEQDAIRTKLTIALAQKTAPIITTAPILHAFLMLRQEGLQKANNKEAAINYCKNNELSKQKSVIASQIPFDDSEWDICRTKSGQFYLLLPKNYRIDENPTLGFNIKQLQRTKISSLSNLLTSKSMYFTQKSVEELESIFTLGSAGWIIYLVGHGLKGESIAGIAIAQYQDLLSFFSQSLGVRFLFYSTCFGGGENLVKAYENAAGQVQLPFVLASDATSDSSTSVCPPIYANQTDRSQPFVMNAENDFLKQVITDVSFPWFFALAEKILNKTEESFAAFEKEKNKMLEEAQLKVTPGLDAWGCVLYPVLFKGQTSDSKSRHVPLVFPLYSGYPLAVRRPDHPENTVYILTNPLAQANTEIKVDQQDAFLLYPHAFHGKINISGSKMPLIVSMIPGRAMHVIDTINAPNLNLNDLLLGFINPSLLSDKLFHIKKLTCLNNFPSICSSPKGNLLELENIFIERSQIEAEGIAVIIFLRYADSYFQSSITLKIEENPQIKFSQCSEAQAKNDIDYLVAEYRKNGETPKEPGALKLNALFLSGKPKKSAFVLNSEQREQHTSKLNRMLDVVAHRTGNKYQAKNKQLKKCLI